MRGWQPVAVVLAMVVGLGVGLAAPRPTSAWSEKPVDVYVELASANPAAGCVVDVSVEVRSEGDTVSTADVVLAMVINGELTATDRAVTGDNGVAWLVLDTSAGWAGADGWVDVNINGTYVGGTSLDLTDDGPCSGNSRLWTVSHAVWLPEPGEAAQDAAEVVDDAASATGATGWVPTYFQQRPLSCEYASLTIATGAFGPGVSEWTFDELAGWSDNPHWGYRGDIWGTWGNTDDYGIYAEALVWPLAQVGFYGEAFYAQGDSSALTTRLDQGRPTLVWLALWGDLSFDAYTADGTRYKLVPGLHVVVAYTYDSSGVWVSDPATGSYRFFDWGTFMWMWNVLDGMGLSVSPA